MTLTRPRTARRFLCALLGLLSLGWGLSWGAAQNPLDAYRTTRDALAESVAALATDAVASLDALRRAEAAFAPLSRTLEPGLQGGLGATFARAEQAIVNESPTDLRVQVAVLRGGVQRTLYARALGAARSEPAAARRLLGILATDLEFAETEFAGEGRAALQTAFEARLGALSLARLEALENDREGRYETLASLYNYLFLVQDSPRLPPETQATLLSAIDRLVAGEAQEGALTTLRAQLERFAAAATEAAAAAQAAGSAATGRESERDTPAAEHGAQVAPTQVPPTRGPNRLAESLAGSLADSLATAAPGNPTVTPETPDAPRSEPRPAQTLEQSTAPAPPAAEAEDAAPTAPAEEPVGLIGDLRAPLLVAAGVLALAALLQLLRRARSSLTPWRDAALALLLLPAIFEGLLALAAALAPTLGAPALGDLTRFSLFVAPTTQLLWVLLVALAVLLLTRGWRRDSGAGVGEAPEQEGRARPPATRTPAPSASHLAARSTLDWDEDF